MRPKMNYQQKMIESERKLRERAAEVAAKNGPEPKRPILSREKVVFFSGPPSNHKLF